VQNTIQELVDESPTLTLSSNAGAAGREEDDSAEDSRRHEIKVLIPIIFALTFVRRFAYEFSLDKFIYRDLR
jgi:hypothetical protein